MYQALAPFYDVLVEDAQATNAWVDLIKDVTMKGKLLDIACGSGDVAIALSKQGYLVEASDISEEMLQMARKKDEQHKVTWFWMDMLSFSVTGLYEGITCLCDSLNYLIEENQVLTVFQQVYDHLIEGGVFVFDVHSLDRLVEFKEEYIEDGYIDNTAYEWTIYAEAGYIYQNFVFYDEAANPTLEQHIQKLYDPLWLQSALETIGFHVSIRTDFDQVGVHEGEKYFFVAKKGR